MFLTAKNIRVVHGFTTKTLGDDKTKIAQALGKKSVVMVTLKQIHSNRVHVISGLTSGRGEGDGLVTQAEGFLIAIRTADCVPILLHDPVSKTIAALHAGWRGLQAGIVENGIKAMAGLGAKMSDIKVAIGPAICGQCFEVGPEVWSYFVTEYGKEVIVQQTGEKATIQLKLIATKELTQTGISLSNIDIINRCTKCEADFYSYRGGDQTGRQCSFIGLMDG